MRGARSMLWAISKVCPEASLMTKRWCRRPLVVVRQNGDNDAFPLDLHIALPVLKGLLNQILVGGWFEWGNV